MLGKKIDANAEFKENYTRISQRVFEPYTEFLRKLMNAIQRHVKEKKLSNIYQKLSFENANKDCQAILCFIREGKPSWHI